MTDKIKMANVFDLPVMMDECNVDLLTEITGRHISEFPSAAYAHAVTHAINNHDRLTAENETLREEVERLKKDNDHQRERRNAAHAIEKGKQERKAIEQERDHLKSVLDNIMKYADNLCK